MIRFENVSKSYGANMVIKDLNFTVEQGQLVVLIGPSGCGKTTTLRLINRLIDPTSGHIFIDGKDANKLDPVELRRSIGYVIQEIGLFPHMTIEQNIEIVPKLLKWPEDKRKERTRELFRLIDMDPDIYLSRYPANLSGGQQQRIGVLRALAAQPPVILMDEPFGALDPITREALQDEIKSLQKKLKKTIVFVTHDMSEAIKLADIIVIMKDGEIVQADHPENLLNNPKNAFVEQFIGKHRQYNASLDKVCDIMRTQLTRTTPDKGIAESIALMQSRNVNTLMIVDENKNFLGYVTIEMISDRLAQDGQDVATIGSLMDTSAPSISPDASAREAFDMLVNKRLDIIAVVENGKLVGVVTKTSMVRSLAKVVWKEAANG